MDINYEIRTHKNLSEAVDVLKFQLSQVSFGVLWELNFKEKLKDKGLDFDNNFIILEVCNPRKAKQVLDIHIEAGYFLPCKVVVYEKEDSVYMGMLKPTILINLVEKEDLTAIAKEVEAELKKAIDLAAE